MSSLNPTHSKSNHKEPWFWFVLAPLMVIVCICSVLVYVAVSGSDDIVIDDYYKEGRLINNRFDLELEAAKRSLALQVSFDLLTEEVVVQSVQPLRVPSLSLTLSHPADVSKDLVVLLSPTKPTFFRAELPTALQGRWYVILNGLEGETPVWRMSSELDFTQSTSLSLKPNQG